MTKPRKFLRSLFLIILVIFTFIKLFGFGNRQFFNSETGEPTDRLWLESSQPVPWMLNDQGAPNITDGSDLTAVQNGFDSWENLPTSSIAFTFAGETSETDFGADGINLITFADSTTLARIDDGFLAFTSTSFFTRDTDVAEPGADFDSDGDIDFPPGFYPAGTIVDSDIVFSDEFNFSTDGSGFDIEATATHEIGHFHGLSHSVVLDATMFPFSGLVSEEEARTLEPDDIIGSSFYYPDGNFFTDYGAIAGKIIDGASGLGIPGAHVFAVDASVSRGDTIVGFFSGLDGSYLLPGLNAGRYYVGVEPLDGDPPGLDPLRISNVVGSTAETDFPAEYWDSRESNDEFVLGNVNTVKTAINVTSGVETQSVDILTQAFPGRIKIEQYGAGDFVLSPSFFHPTRPSDGPTGPTDYFAVKFDLPFRPPFTITEASIATASTSSFSTSFPSLILARGTATGQPDLSNPLATVRNFRGSLAGSFNTADFPDVTITQSDAEVFLVLKFPGGSSSARAVFDGEFFTSGTLENGYFPNSFVSFDGVNFMSLEEATINIFGLPFSFNLLFSITVEVDENNVPPNPPSNFQAEVTRRGAVSDVTLTFDDPQYHADKFPLTNLDSINLVRKGTSGTVLETVSIPPGVGIVRMTDLTDGRFEFVTNAIDSEGNMSLSSASIFLDLSLFINADHTVGDVLVTVTNFGSIGHDVLNNFGAGFQFPIGTNQLFEGSMMIGTGPEQVSDNFRTLAGGPDRDLLPLEVLTFNPEDPDPDSDEDIVARFNDSLGENPTGLEIRQESFAFAGDDFIILKYTIENTSPSAATGNETQGGGISTVDNVFVGLALDWDLGGNFFGSNVADFEENIQSGYFTETRTPEVVGAAVLTSPGVTSFRVDLASNTANPQSAFDGLDATKFQFMSEGVIEPSDTPADYLNIIATGPFSIAPGSSVEVAFALLGGEGADDFRANVEAARDRFTALGGTVFIPGEAIQGDVTGDGTVNVQDLISLINIILDIGEPPTEDEFRRADCNSDGQRNVADLICVINIILGI